jgi:adenylate kinase
MRLIFLGPPGAGKGTMAKRLAEELTLAHISTGDLFRDAISKKTDLGLKVQGIIEKGDLVPDSLTVKLVEERIERPDCENGFILDGFPRTIPQAEALGDLVEIDTTVNFHLSDDEIIKRLSGRRMCPACGKTYHIHFMPPKKEALCDGCGGALIIRKDDRIDSIVNRLKVYKDQTAPLIDYYTNRKLIRTIDASPDPDTVYSSLREVLNTR